MTHFPYLNGQLHVENVPVARMAEEVGTPFYCYSTAAITDHYQAYVSALQDLDAKVYYSLKANSNQAVVATLARLGAGGDVVSLGEMYRALKAGIPADKIVFAGVGKTRDELAEALKAGIHQINVESESELDTLSEVAKSLGKQAVIALRINPDIDAKTHAKISTGKSENKFGIDIDHAAQIYSRAARLPGIRVAGISCHIGSQLTDLTPYRAAFSRIAELVTSLRRAGLPVERVDLGGGIGIAYRNEQTIDLKDYAAAVREIIAPLGCAIELEPGRSIVGNAGLLITRVINVKSGVSRKFVILDAAMNDLIRPTLYDAYHDIIPVMQPSNDDPVSRVDIVGPVCETGDRFAEQRAMSPLQAGDLVAICSAGAYGAVMASTYNTRLPPAEVLVKGDAFQVVRPRPTYDAIIGQDSVPSWL
ncbi:diaminopimelate decarboxylase [Dongia soli]|uniref:Diaminopimelate decarboxylase n=1 Tax=Dongia soli TaxID=600628 RepID=A0ABU5E4R9_9PROT|nr:diaminopimelate decarboxylase [Dongia soli]MDY0881250.1 diaminopimelate decarboxylase [Dongia soli]